MNLFENLQMMKENDNVPDRNQKSFLKDMIEFLSEIKEQETISQDCNTLIFDIYDKILELKDSCKQDVKTESSVTNENQNNIETFINTPVEELVDGKLIKLVYDEYANDHKQLPKGMDALNPEYDDVKGQFYNKYYNVAQKCKEIDKSPKFNPSGYGGLDYFILKARDKCRQIDYNFPYGWKQFGKVRESL